jgi:hypothetical protein
MHQHHNTLQSYSLVKALWAPTCALSAKPALGPVSGVTHTLMPWFGVCRSAYVLQVTTVTNETV